MSEDKSDQQLTKWYKEIEMIGIDIKGLDRDIKTGRFKLKTDMMNAHFISELYKIGTYINGREIIIGMASVHIRHSIYYTA
jgi:hypothetical protein